jgi:hypothetical protein
MIRKEAERALGSTLLVDSRKVLENNMRKDRGFTIRNRIQRTIDLVENSKALYSDTQSKPSLSPQEYLKDKQHIVYCK